MPVYTYRREDGSTFELRQSFSDAPLTADPETGQKVVRLVQGTGVIFKGSGFYVNDSKGSKQSLSGTSKSDNGNANGDSGKPADAKSDTSKAEAPSKAEAKPAATND